MRRLIDAIAPPRLGADFRRLVGSEWASNLGDGIGLAAAPLLIASLTDDPLVIAAGALVQRLPWLLIGLHAGVIADRVHRGRLIFFANLVRVAVLAVLMLTIVSDAITPTIVLVAFFLLAVGEVLVDTTAQTLLPMLVDDEDLGLGNARFQFGFQALNQLVGPALGGALFALGSAIPFAAQGIGMLLGAILVIRIRFPPIEAPSADPGIGAQIAEGFRWLLGNGPMRTLALTIFVFNLTFGASFSLLVLLAEERLGLGGLGFGLLTSASAAGGVVGAMLWTRIERLASPAWMLRIGLIIESVTHLVLGVTTTAWIAFSMLVVFGIHTATWGTIYHTIRQRLVPLELQGRVTSVYMVGLHVGLLIGAAVGGLLARIGDVTTPYWFAFVGSAITIPFIWRPLGELDAEGVSVSR